METPPHPFEALAQLAAEPVPAARAEVLGKALADVPKLQAWLRRARQDAVLEMRAEGLSHGDVGKALGISRARAQQIAEGRTTGKRKSDDAADDEARDSA